MLFKLILKNIFRARLRSALTLLGLVVAVVAFGLLRTVVDAWYAGSDAASGNRLITRNAISLTFTLPTYYRERVKGVDGVSLISMSNWFGGIYQEPKNFFPQFAVTLPVHFELYPEYVLPPEQMQAMLRDRTGTIVGRAIADQYGWKIGDKIPIQGTIYPGTWEFTVRGIYEGRDEGTLTRQLYFHWDYLNERLKVSFPRAADRTGVLVVGIKDAQRSAEMSQAIDAEFKNSLAETLTETEKAFQLGFVAQSEAIIAAIRIVSFVVIFIILAVVANTMAMAARERISEYATLKALGFAPSFVSRLVIGESIAITLLGALIGIAVSFPVTAAFKSMIGSIFPVFRVSDETLVWQFASMVVVGLLAAIVPAIRSARIKIVDGLRHVA
ncbi:MAG: FtsX-like permease family protein [Betaproteobacteria bacterium]|nr:MAG: FtsX-like permease family protein [Betaproteobacteria bacterium]TAG47612.1 MAG: FtsX-like permease family protein [Betaproteobacteria bacterium]